jgi:hypothetical protein
MIFVGTHEVFTRTGRLCILLSNSICLVFPHLVEANVKNLVSYFQDKVQHRLKGTGCSAALRKYM